MDGSIQGSPAITDFLETFSFSKNNRVTNAERSNKSSKITFVGNDINIVVV